MSYRDGASPVQRWEHAQEKVETKELDETLLKRSQEGWELVSAGGIENNTHWDANYRLFWKRLV